MRPKISFVVPTYNRMEWLGETLQGLLAQTVQDSEVIVVDDGSDDGTREFLEDWGSKFQRLRVHYNETNLGAGPSRNIGMEMAEAPILGVCDSDDIYATEHAELILKHFDLNPESEMVNFPYISIGYCNENLEEFEGAPFDHEIFKEKGVINYFCNPSVGIKKASLQEIGGYPKETESKTDDVQMLANWVNAGKKVDFQPGYSPCFHRILPNSIMAKQRGFDPKWLQK